MPQFIIAFFKTGAALFFQTTLQSVYKIWLTMGVRNMMCIKLYNIQF
jgi:hypothetical protein